MNDPLIAAGQEIDEKRARILGSILCGDCQKTLATLYATTAGRYWRILDRGYTFHSDNEIAEGMMWRDPYSGRVNVRMVADDGELRDKLLPNRVGPGISVHCSEHGFAKVPPARINAARARRSGKKFRIFVDWEHER